MHWQSGRLRRTTTAARQPLLLPLATPPSAPVRLVAAAASGGSKSTAPNRRVMLFNPGGSPEEPLGMIEADAENSVSVRAGWLAGWLVQTKGVAHSCYSSRTLQLHCGTWHRCCIGAHR